MQQGSRQRRAGAGPPEGLPANSLPQAKSLKPKPLFFGFLLKTLIFFLNPRNLNCVKTHKRSHKKLTQTHKHTLKL
jgi:hypothetical protein